MTSHTLIKDFSGWALTEDNILAVGLVGSYASGKAREDSDIDLMIIVSDQQKYLKDEHWITRFGPVEKIEDESWGRLKTKRVFYKNGPEVEFNFDTEEWVNPQDSGTRRVVTDGMKILVDKSGILQELLNGIE